MRNLDPRVLSIWTWGNKADQERGDWSQETGRSAAFLSAPGKSYTSNVARMNRKSVFSFCLQSPISCLLLERTFMELIRFIFWEAAKVLGLVFLAMVAAKGVKGLTGPKAWVRPALYGVMLVLVTLGAWFAGNDVAAEVYMWSSDSSLARGDLVKAYANAIQAVNLRPNNMSYWHTLMRTKMSRH